MAKFLKKSKGDRYEINLDGRRPASDRRGLRKAARDEAAMQTTRPPPPGNSELKLENYKCLQCQLNSDVLFQCVCTCFLHFDKFNYIRLVKL